MTPNAEIIWRELHTQAGPSSAIKYLEIGIFAGMSVEDLGNGIDELLKIGALSQLDGDELSRISEHQRVAGDLAAINLDTARHFRVVDPKDLRQSNAARIEYLRRELSQLLPRLFSIDRQLAGDGQPPGWTSEGWRLLLASGIGDRSDREISGLFDRMSEVEF